ncbi:MAG: CmcI family methyltransferase, partial [Thermoanaerobaculia bacterium]
QEILFEVRPDVIIECGTFQGGSALYLATICDLLDQGRIYTVDVEPRPELPLHPRIEYVRGSSISEEVTQYLHSRIDASETVLIILDSDHSRDHVLAELERYAQFVTTGSYIIVEDTNVNGHPVFPDHGPGPMEALTDFMSTHQHEFAIDEEREKFFLTFNPRGFLRFLGRRPKSATATMPFSNASAAGSPDRHYRYHFDFGRERDTAHSRALRLVGTDKRVLDLGCGAGIVARHLATQGCEVVGIEGDRALAQESSAICERVIVSDLSTADWEHELGSDRFDAVTALDVLEHLADPVACLRALRRFIRPGGYVVASIPNIAHGSMRLALLSGEFEYRDLGLLDRTHLRFFTRQTMEQLFDEAGYAVRTIERIELPLTATEIPLPEDTPAALTDWLNADEEARTYQFIVVASPIRHGSEAGLRERLREVSAENHDLRQRLQSLMRPVDVSAQDDSAIVDDSLRRRMLQFRATILDLRRQLAQRQSLIERVQADLLARSSATEPLVNVLKAREGDIAKLNEYVRNQTEESTRYAVSLNQALVHKDDELRHLYAQVQDKEAVVAELASLANFLQEHMSESERYAASLNDALTRKEDELVHLQSLADTLQRRADESDRALLLVQSDRNRAEGELVALRSDRSRADELERLRAELQASNADMAGRLEASQRELEKIHGSRVWRLATLYWRVLDVAKRMRPRR